MRRATIEERGNGLAGAGEYVSGDDGELYRIVRTKRPIHTGSRAGAANYIHAIVEHADWNDIGDEDEPYCTAVVGGR